ncbi:MAG TPA: hypothetical protein VN861_13895 [Candidatus Acidoferrales bacterium]|nr:hypothetical protein [Candidatus Acidoferrales bacterium]
MRASGWVGACTLLLLLAAPAAKAQDKPAAETPAPEVIEQPAKLQIVLTEYEGTKKISSMPYSIPFILSRASLTSSLRMGVRVPVNTTSKAGESSLTYVDVGTNIDVSDIDYRINQSHLLSNPGRFSVQLRIDRSSLYVPSRDKDGRVDGGKDWTAGEPPPGNEPMIRQFRGDVTLLMRDGQELETTVATDPLTGHVLKVEATLNVLK